MPPKQKITKENVIQAALNLIRKGGIATLTARNIAQILNCSTQPVYSSFKNMEALEEAVVKKAILFVQETYLTRESERDTHFKNIGLGYILMAKEEAHLFDLLYLSGRVPLDFENYVFPIDTDLLISVMKKDLYLSALPKSDLLKILCHMWIYTHGLTLLMRTNPDISTTFLEDSLEEIGHMVIKELLLKRGVMNNEDFSHKW